MIENGQQLETADGQIIQHQVDNGGSVIKRIQQPGGAIVTIKTKGESGLCDLGFIQFRYGKKHVADDTARYSKRSVGCVLSRARPTVTSIINIKI